MTDRINEGIPTNPDLVIELVKGDFEPLSPAEADRIIYHKDKEHLRGFLKKRFPRVERFVPEIALAVAVRLLRSKETLPSEIDKKQRPYLDSLKLDPDAKNVIRITGRPPAGPNA